MKVLPGIVISILIIALGFAWYIGVFATIKVEDKITGGYKVIGREYTGPYSEAGKVIEEVSKKLKTMGIESSKSFGIYYDDPKTTPAEKCRSFVGGILEEKDVSKRSVLNTDGLRIDSIPQSASVVTEFPLKTSLSYMIGPMKAYPALSKYIAENKYKVTLSLEIYDMNEKRITYIMQYNK